MTEDNGVFIDESFGLTGVIQDLEEGARSYGSMQQQTHNGSDTQVTRSVAHCLVFQDYLIKITDLYREESNSVQDISYNRKTIEALLKGEHILKASRQTGGIKIFGNGQIYRIEPTGWKVGVFNHIQVVYLLNGLNEFKFGKCLQSIEVPS